MQCHYVCAFLGIKSPKNCLILMLEGVSRIPLHQVKVPFGDITIGLYSDILF